jgi:hypothetical protein
LVLPRGQTAGEEEEEEGEGERRTTGGRGRKSGG